MPITPYKTDLTAVPAILKNKPRLIFLGDSIINWSESTKQHMPGPAIDGWSMSPITALWEGWWEQRKLPASQASGITAGTRIDAAGNTGKVALGETPTEFQGLPIRDIMEYDFPAASGNTFQPDTGAWWNAQTTTDSVGTGGVNSLAVATNNAAQMKMRLFYHATTSLLTYDDNFDLTGAPGNTASITANMTAVSTGVFGTFVAETDLPEVPIHEMRCDQTSGAFLTDTGSSSTKLVNNLATGNNQVFGRPSLVATDANASVTPGDFAWRTFAATAIAYPDIQPNVVGTITGFVNLNTLTNDSLLIQYQGVDANEYWNLWVDSNGSLQTRWVIGGTTYADGSAAGLIVAGTTYHIAATRTGGNVVTVFINGVDVGGGATLGTIGSASTTCVIGGYTNGTMLDGDIDEIRVYTSALSAVDIARHYRSASQTATAGGPRKFHHLSEGDPDAAGRSAPVYGQINAIYPDLLSNVTASGDHVLSVWDSTYSARVPNNDRYADFAGYLFYETIAGDWNPGTYIQVLGDNSWDLVGFAADAIATVALPKQHSESNLTHWLDVTTLSLTQEMLVVIAVAAENNTVNVTRDRFIAIMDIWESSCASIGLPVPNFLLWQSPNKGNDVTLNDNFADGLLQAADTRPNAYGYSLSRHTDHVFLNSATNPDPEGAPAWAAANIGPSFSFANTINANLNGGGLEGNLMNDGTHPTDTESAAWMAKMTWNALSFIPRSRIRNLWTQHFRKPQRA